MGIDVRSDGADPPKTITRYAMQDTPTMLLIDREGRLRKQKFVGVKDLALGAGIMSLMRVRSVIQSS